jgi:hypothetical protein
MTLWLAVSKGDREDKGVTVALPHGRTRLCPAGALQHWLDAAARYPAAALGCSPWIRRLAASPKHLSDHGAASNQLTARLTSPEVAGGQVETVTAADARPRTPAGPAESLYRPLGPGEPKEAVAVRGRRAP